MRVEENSSTTDGNTVSRNSIYDNTDKGIELIGLANDDQAAPTITAASASPVTVEGSLSSLASSSFRLEFFASPSCDSSGKGEGKRYLGSKDVTTPPGSGTVAFTAALSGTVAVGEVVTATATNTTVSVLPAENLFGNTSEFSSCLTTTVNTTVIFSDGFESGDTSAWE